MRTKKEIVKGISDSGDEGRFRCAIIEVLVDIRDLWEQQVETAKRSQLDQAAATEMLERATHDQHVIRKELVGSTEAERAEEMIEELPDDGPLPPPCCEHAMHGALGSKPPENTFQCGVCGNLWVIEKDRQMKLMKRGE